MAIGIVSAFILITGAGMITGNWQNNISKEEYLFHYGRLNSYGHPTSTESVEQFNREANGKQTESMLKTIPDKNKLTEENKN